MANEWIKKFASDLSNLAKTSRFLVAKHIQRKQVDLTNSVIERILSGKDAEGNDLEPLTAATLQSLVTDDNRPNEGHLGHRLEFGRVPMVATGRTLQNIRVISRGTDIEIIVTDQKARDIIEMHSVEHYSANTKGRLIHLKKFHQISTTEDTVIHRPIRRILGFTEEDAERLGDSLRDEIDIAIQRIL